MHLIPVRDGVICSVVLGREDAPPVVMIHGLVFGNMATWYSSLGAPLARHHRVMLYDQRGHGSSPVSATGYSVDTQVEDLQAVLAYHGVAAKQVDIVGHSMGAVVALHFALNFPKQVRRLVLVDAPLPLEQHVLPDLMNVTSPEVLASYVEVNRGKLKGRRLDRLHQRLKRLFFHSTLVADLRESHSLPRGKIEQLIVPTLLVYGRHSHCLESAWLLQQILPQANLALLECGHYVVEDEPDALRQLVIAFLGEDI